MRPRVVKQVGVAEGVDAVDDAEEGALDELEPDAGEEEVEDEEGAEVGMSEATVGVGEARALS